MQIEDLPSETICEILLCLTATESQAISVVSKNFNSMTKITNQRNWTNYYKLAGGSIVKDNMVYNLQYNEEYYNPWSKQPNFYQLCDDLFCYNETENVIIIRSIEDELLRWDLEKPSRIISCDFTSGNAYFTPRLTLHIQSGNENIEYYYYYQTGEMIEQYANEATLSENFIHISKYEIICIDKGVLKITELNSTPIIVSEEVENASYFNGVIYFIKKGIIYSRDNEKQIMIKY